MDEKSKGAHSAGWWVISKEGVHYKLTRKTEDGSVQVVSSKCLAEAIEIASSIGGKNV